MNCQKNLCELYRSLCAEESCHINSAVLQYIETNVSLSPLHNLMLERNYLGPRGLRPVIRLVERCQTLTHLSLEGNGADNNTVKFLCTALQQHPNMQWISLRSNPITVTGGKYILSLVESNPRIIAVDLSETDVFAGLIYKINAVTEANRVREAEITPQLTPSEAINPLAMNNRMSFQDAQPFRKRSLLKTLPVLTQAIISTTQKANTAFKPQITAEKEGETPVIVKVRPRSPIPAIASRDASELPLSRQHKLLRQYRERAALLRQTNASQASKAANRAREELMLLEQCTKPQKCGKMSETKHRTKSTRVVHLPHEDGDKPIDINFDTDEELIAQPQSSLECGETGDKAQLTLDTVTEVSSIPNETNSVKSNCDDGENTRMVEGTEGCTVTSICTDKNVGAAETMVVGEDEHISLEILRESERWMTLGSREQFQLLFDSGSRAYIKQQFDAAYTAWNEAMNVAVNQKNREWMAILTSNLQRLSYEILVREGVAHLKKDQLEEADLVFQRAMEVSEKAGNAKWKAEVRQAREDVQKAVFQRSHESALKFFKKAQHVPKQKVTSDDYYIVPGTDVMTSHSETYVNEWSRMLLIKEAVEIWVSLHCVIGRISGNAGRMLLRELESAMEDVALYLAQKCFDAEDTQSLSWMHSSLYTYQEVILLNSLWIDMASSSKLEKHHKLFAAIAAAQIGNYHLATNQLREAQTQFDNLAKLAGDLKDSLLCAAGRTFSAFVNWQRARYTDAEALLRETVVQWGALREMAHLQRNGVYDGTLCNNSNYNTTTTINNNANGSVVGNGVHSALLASVPCDYITLMEAVSFRFLVSSITNTYRYAEAMEVLEHSLILKYRDLLFEKMKVNFTAQPTIDHIVAISTHIRSPLLYYLVTHRYEWSSKENKFFVNEKLLIWVVPQGKTLRFVELDVTKDFKVPSISTLIDIVQKSLLIHPLSQMNAKNDDIICTLPSQTWMEPLQILHSIFIDPVVDILRALNPLLMGKNGVITFVPTERLWLIPFNALIARNGNFLVEDFAVQVAFCATQCAFASLSAVQVQQRNLQRDLVIVQPEVEEPAPHLNSYVTFPYDFTRSANEGELIMQTFSKSKRYVRRSSRSPDVIITTTSSEMLVDNLEAARVFLPRSRMVHIATSTTCATQNDESSAGALCVVDSQESVSLLRSSEIARMEIFSELVVLSNTNMSNSRVVGTHDDVLGLARGFFAAGVPCVIVGQWCTPDMIPSVVFSNLYTLLLDKNKEAERTSRETSVSELNTDAASSAAAAAVEAEARKRMISSLSQELADQSEATPHLHKALILALAVRALLDVQFFRYSPRTWAGYLCIGCGSR